MEKSKRMILHDRLDEISESACHLAYALGYDNQDYIAMKFRPHVATVVEHWTKDMTREELIATIRLLAFDNITAWLPSNYDLQALREAQVR